MRKSWTMMLAAMALGAGVPAHAQSLYPDEILSSLIVRPISAPNPVLSADGRVHLAYELLLNNASPLFITVDKIEALDPQGRVLRTLDGAHLKDMTMQHAGDPPVIPPGGSATVFMDVSFAQGQPLPQSVSARISALRQAVDANGKPTTFAPGQAVPASYVFTGGTTTLGPPAREIESPLRGKNWVAANGCCDAITPHRGALITVNGTIHGPERFANDWVRIDAQNRASEGDYKKLANWPYYGDTIHSVADGTVVNVYDEAPEQVPGTPTDITMANIGGNMMVIDIGGGHYAFYAHLQKGSLRYRLGDKVRTGDVVGLLGNTGNTTAPHLHFHLMDGKSPLNSNGIPYVFRQFTGRGVIPSGEDEKLDTGGSVTIQPKFLGEHRRMLPVDNQVVDFPER